MIMSLLLCTTFLMCRVRERMFGYEPTSRFWKRIPINKLYLSRRRNHLHHRACFVMQWIICRTIPYVNLECPKFWLLVKSVTHNVSYKHLVEERRYVLKARTTPSMYQVDSVHCSNHNFYGHYGFVEAFILSKHSQYTINSVPRAWSHTYRT